MGQAKNLARIRHSRCNSLFRDSAIGRGDSGALAAIASRTMATLVESTVGCHIVAATVCTLATMGLLIFWDRSAPIEYLMPYATPNEIHAGDHTRLVMRLSKVSRMCKGEFTRSFVDSGGRRFAMGKFETVYQYFVNSETKQLTYPKDITIPLTDADAKAVAAGPGVYESLPEWWCNPVQWLYPIQGVPVRIPIKILPKE